MQEPQQEQEIPLSQPVESTAEAKDTEAPAPAAAGTGGGPEDMLSPVSKLQLKRRRDAAEQQKRIDAVLAREKDNLKRQIRKRKQLEARLEDHLKKKIRKLIPDPEFRVAQKPVDEEEDEEEPEVVVPISVQDDDSGDAAKVSKVAMNLSSAFEEADEQDTVHDMEVDEEHSLTTDSIPRKDHELEDLTKVDQVSKLEMVEGDEITKTLLEGTRARLKVLAARGVVQEIVPEPASSPNQVDLNSVIRPMTNYHLKRMGLAEKVDIYAPLHEQEMNVRKVMREWQEQGDELQEREDSQAVNTVHTTVSASFVANDSSSFGGARYRQPQQRKQEDDLDSEYVPDHHEDEESESISLAETESESEVKRLLREKDMPLDELVQATAVGGGESDLPTPAVLLGFCVLFLALLWLLDMDKLLKFLENAAKVTRNAVTGDDGEL